LVKCGDNVKHEGTLEGREPKHMLVNVLKKSYA
jgi:hypothetical protein